MAITFDFPAHRYTFPHEVVDDPSLSPAQKREILSAWASDASAVESFPTLRQLPGSDFPVTLSAVMDARYRLDRMMQEEAVEADAGTLVAIDFAKNRKRGSGS